ncbi:ABC transporter involved in cytochrome c biogenesis, ATPase component CcmA [hydrothermal vent metagenome]|uniref:ABC transporter involved in cytochrome c biogenesis, ATPase component CcmA n=1 Tax=hydrothermal vent metagenome TaxID=652676 RepID=A0A1W1BQE8_9ZZZZ
MNSISFNISCQKGYIQIFKNKKYTLKSGDILQLVGRNGSGKTSLLKILATLSNTEESEILINGKTQNEDFLENSYYLGHLPAISPQLTVLENLTFLLALKQNINQHSLTNALENVGLKYYKNELCANLSAGQKRRVALASLFVNDASLWLLDEPFTALDTQGVEMIENLIKQHCKKGGICIFTTHQPPQLFQPKILQL